MLTCNVANETECGIADKYIALPGGIALTLKTTSPTQTTPIYSIQNFHGDTAITVGANGLPTSSVYLYDPFGQVVSSNTFGTSAVPNNATGDGMGWATSPSRKQESLFTLPIAQLGVRTYLPTIGRFIQVDPVEGGTPNAYTYVLDPINYADYNGQWGWPKWVKKAAKVAVAAIVVVGIVAIAVAVAPIIASSATAMAVTAAASAVAVRAAPAISRLAPTISRGAAKGAAAVKSVGVQVASVFRRVSMPKVTSSSSTLTRPGPYASQSIPARTTSSQLRVAERQQLNSIGNTYGCHSCGRMSPGTRSGNWIADHQPVSSLNRQGLSQRLYPHCLGCSAKQGAEAASILRDLGL